MSKSSIFQLPIRITRWKIDFYTRKVSTNSIWFKESNQSACKKSSNFFRSANRPYLKYGFALVISGIIGYDGLKNDFVYSGAGLRFFRSLKTASFIAVDYLLLRKNDPDYKEKLKEVHTRSANRLVKTCMENGGLYIKIGQGVAAVNHILPKEYCTILMKLQDECELRPISDVQKVFYKEYGKLPDEIFAEFDYKAVAAASLAQVFKAKLKNGDYVAVKVQYSDLEKRFVSDLGTIIFLQSIVEFFFKNYNFGWILKNLRNNLVQELNFLQEGKNAELCAEHLKNISDARVPQVYWEYAKKRVLVLEWIDGTKISDMDYIHKNKLCLKAIDRKLFEVFANQIFRTGFVHADPHSSNIFVRKNEETGKPEIILLDHGLYENVPENIRIPLCEFWEATVLRDKDRMATAAAKLNVKEYMKFAEVLFQQPVEIESTGIKNKLSEEDIQIMQNLAKENFERIMDTLKEMPRNLLFVVRNLNTIRAISRMHGDIVNRPKVMARYSHKYLTEHSTKNSFFGYIRSIFHGIYFDYCLWKMNFKVSLMQYYFILLYWFGRAPKSAKTVIKELLRDNFEGE